MISKYQEIDSRGIILELFKNIYNTKIYISTVVYIYREKSKIDFNILIFLYCFISTKTGKVYKFIAYQNLARKYNNSEIKKNLNTVIIIICYEIETVLEILYLY